MIVILHEAMASKSAICIWPYAIPVLIPIQCKHVWGKHLDCSSPIGIKQGEINGVHNAIRIDIRNCVIGKPRVCHDAPIGTIDRAVLVALPFHSPAMGRDEGGRSLGTTIWKCTRVKPKKRAFGRVCLFPPLLLSFFAHRARRAEYSCYVAY